MTTEFYVPILKSKLGEFQALSRLKDSLKNYIIPLLEVTPIEWDFATRAKPRTIEEHLIKFSDKIGKHWKRSNCFIDTYLINSIKIRNTSCMERVFNLLDNFGLTPIPVLHIAAPKDFSDSIKRMITKYSLKEFGVRVKPEDVTSPEFDRELQNLLAEYKLKPENCHLILDLQDANFSIVEDITDSILSILESFPMLSRWKTFTVCGSAFPSTSQIKGPEAKISRNDWKFYKLLTKKLRKESFNRAINYGDYSIVNPQYFEFNPQTMSSSANIRYTHDDIWYVQKGKALKKAEDWKQYKAQAKAIMKSAYYLGENFSAGDLHFTKCVKGQVLPGSPTVWNWVGNNHHFTKVISDLFSIPSGS